MSFEATKPFVALGVMSGTSLDGIDVVRVVTDGADACDVTGHFYAEYAPALRAGLAAVAKGDVPLSDLLRLERELSIAYVEALMASGFVDGAAVIGVHGQTIRHLPKEGLTWQLGDMNYIAQKTSVPVVGDFRRRDMAAGGEGAPLVPLFHAMMLRKAGIAHGAVLNIGGVANVTVVNPDGAITASDCGPGVGLLNAWVQQKTGEAFDKDGQLALAGHVDKALVDLALAEMAFWQRPVPRSADRYDFDEVLAWVQPHNVADGAATLAALTSAGIAETLNALGGAEVVYAGGGGARNKAILNNLDGFTVKPVSDLGFDEQTVEAACFAWLAVRRLKGLPFSQPSTTHCETPTVGGVVTA